MDMKSVAQQSHENMTDLVLIETETLNANDLLQTDIIETEMDKMVRMGICESLKYRMAIS